MFALSFYRSLAKTEGNLFFSPMSIAQALAMVLCGARGRTAEQILELLQNGNETSPGTPEYPAQLLSPAKKSELQFNVANAIWAHKDYSFFPDYLDRIRRDFDAEHHALDFAYPEPARQKLNEWIERQTEHQIHDLIPPGLLNPATRMVLTNAIYFYGAWRYPFDPEDTTHSVFHVSPRSSVSVPFMSVREEFNYAEFDQLQALEMPYGDSGLSMLVLLPKDLHAIKRLELLLNENNLRLWRKSVVARDVAVCLPRFSAEQQFDAVPALAQLGISDAIDSGAADFSGMDGGREIFLSAMVHKAKIEVTEQGTMAAAATGLELALCAPSSIPLFRADHPFIYLIQDTNSGTILFIGRLSDPTQPTQ